MDYSAFFWGRDEAPDRDEIESILNRFEVVDDSPDGLVCIDVNHRWGVGILNIMAFPDSSPRAGYRLIERAIGIAIDMGLRKLTAIIVDGNPMLKVGPRRPGRLGWRLEGVLKGHAFLGGKIRDAFIYSMEV